MKKITDLFRREITLNRVRDNITIREGNETLTLRVDSDATSIVSRLRNAQEEMAAVRDDTPETDAIRAARNLSESMFGKEQTDRLFEFYNGDASCVATICGMYFGDPKHGLCRKIITAQKKRK